MRGTADIGFYWVQGSKATGTQPINSYYFIALLSSTGVTIQIAFLYDNSKIYYRKYVNTSWSSWVYYTPAST